MSEAGTGDTVAIETGAVGGDTGTLNALAETSTGEFDFAASLGEHSALAEQFDSPEALAKSYSELRAEYSGRPKVPENGAYDLPTVEGFEFDGDFIGSINEGFAEAGFSQEQVNFALQQHANFEIQKSAAQHTQIKEGLDGLKKEWGENYDTNINLANNLIDKLEIEGLNDLLNDPQYGAHPLLIKAFSRMAELTGESTLPNDAAPSGGMSAEQAMGKLTDLVGKIASEPNSQIRAGLQAEADKLHAIIDGQG